MTLPLRAGSLGSPRFISDRTQRIVYDDPTLSQLVHAVSFEGSHARDDVTGLDALLVYVKELEDEKARLTVECSTLENQSQAREQHVTHIEALLMAEQGVSESEKARAVMSRILPSSVSGFRRQ